MLTSYFGKLPLSYATKTDRESTLCADWTAIIHCVAPPIVIRNCGYVNRDPLLFCPKILQNASSRSPKDYLYMPQFHASQVNLLFIMGGGGSSS